MQEGYKYIKRIHELNDLIPHQRLSELMDKMETVSRSIFEHIAENPDKVSLIRRTVNYYLPSTIKMMETWHEMSTKDVKPDNITSSMEKIENVMETMVKVFEKQLDTPISTPHSISRSKSMCWKACLPRKESNNLIRSRRS